MVIFFSVGTIRGHKQIIRNLYARFQRLTIIIYYDIIIGTRITSHSMIRIWDDDDDMIRLVVQYYERDYAYNHDVSDMKIQCNVASELRRIYNRLYCIK